jgi:hypothetical protein
LNYTGESSASEGTECVWKKLSEVNSRIYTWYELEMHQSPDLVAQKMHFSSGNGWLHHQLAQKS